MASACPSCGAPIRWYELSCRYCGARNERLRDFAESSALVVVLVFAVIVALFVATRERAPSGGTVLEPVATSTPPKPAPPAASDTPQSASPAAAPATPPPAADFTWLEQQMKSCDEVAAADKNSLYFLVIPLVSNPNKEKDWRFLAVNQIGNASVLLVKDAIEALKQGTLTISGDTYIFSLRPGAGQPVHRWDPALGVKEFRFDGAAATASFQLQIKPRGMGRDNDWGATMQHQPGTCYWVTVLPRP